MKQRDLHTWNLILHYHRCPRCGYIIESRHDFDNRMGTWIKDVDCERCHYQFELTKARKPTFGPLIGTPQPSEFDWQ